MGLGEGEGCGDGRKEENREGRIGLLGAGVKKWVFLTEWGSLWLLPGRRQCGIHAAETAEQPVRGCSPWVLCHSVRKITFFNNSPQKPNAPLPVFLFPVFLLPRKLYFMASLPVFVSSLYLLSFQPVFPTIILIFSSYLFCCDFIIKLKSLFFPYSLSEISDANIVLLVVGMVLV